MLQSRHKNRGPPIPTSNISSPPSFPNSLTPRVCGTPWFAPSLHHCVTQRDPDPLGSIHSPSSNSPGGSGAAAATATATTTATAAAAGGAESPFLSSSNSTLDRPLKRPKQSPCGGAHTHTGVGVEAGGRGGVVAEVGDDTVVSPGGGNNNNNGDVTRIDGGSAVAPVVAPSSGEFCNGEGGVHNVGDGGVECAEGQGNRTGVAGAVGGTGVWGGGALKRTLSEGATQVRRGRVIVWLSYCRSEVRLDIRLFWNRFGLMPTQKREKSILAWFLHCDVCLCLCVAQN